MIGMLGFYFGAALLLSAIHDGAMVPFLYRALAYRFDWMPFAWGVLLFAAGALTLAGVWCNASRVGHCFVFRSRCMLLNFVVWGGVCEAFYWSGEYMERGVIYTIFCSIALLKYWRLQARKRDQEEIDSVGERRCL